MPELIPAPEPEPEPVPPPPCTHKETCDLTHDKCCECSDERPIQQEGYLAYTNTLLADAILVPRHYYYCPKCKKRLKEASIELESDKKLKPAASVGASIQHRQDDKQDVDRSQQI